MKLIELTAAIAALLALAAHSPMSAIAKNGAYHR
ncbi:MAG: hypothetical protein QOH95_1939 [Gaiellaceae bacterium]|jgi:hypothetical protein|nr:hypothetical protein [Gaiellaceae bacterium]